VPRFITSIADGRPVQIHGDGSQSRDFTYVANVVDANVRAAHTPGVNGAVLNIATGRKTTVNELVEAVGEMLGLPAEKQFLPDRAGDVRDSWADITAARELLGFEPRVGLEEGLRRAAEAFTGAAALGR